MAEFCLECWNKLNGFQKTERDYVLSDAYDLCEGCGRLCRVIVRERTFRKFYDWRNKKRRQS